MSVLTATPTASPTATPTAGREARLATAALSARDRHFVSRFSFGHTPELAAAVRRAGGGRAWFEDQLSPSRIADQTAHKLDDWYPNLWYTPKQIWNRNDSGVAPAWQLMVDLGCWTMMRRVYSNRQLFEVMVDFWSNLLHIPLGDDEAWPYRVSYDQMIRKHALGRFDDMLVASATHSSMGLYLDNASSTKDAPNENLGRELMELHTVGVDAGYTEKDVKNSARILTGYRVDLWWPKFAAYYSKSDHYTGRIKVMGFSHPNKSPDGRAATKAYLRYLAHHPATADRLARRLCVKFVNDDPSPGLVKSVSRAFTRSGTDIRTTLRAMVAHPEFSSSAGEKVRMPLEETLATVRALGIKPHKPTKNHDFPQALYWVVQGQGMTPYGWPAPNGFPEVSAAWSSAGRALDSLTVHRNLAQRWWPNDGATFPSDKSWLPAMPATYGEVVTHIGKQLLGEPPNARLNAAVAQRTGVALTKRLTADEAKDRVRYVLMILLGSPAHLTR